MRLNRLDLNALMVLDALIELRSASKAARRLSVGQPAVSAALGRLRDHFGDVLFVRTGSEMTPTALALELAGPVRDMLQRAEVIARTRAVFDPMQTSRRFTVSGSDYTQMVLMAHVAAVLEREAPQVQLALRPTPVPHVPEMQPVTEALYRRMHDFTVAPIGAHSTRDRFEVLLEDPFCCIVRQDHPRVRGTLDLATFSQLSHVINEYDDGRVPLVETQALERAGLQRRISTVVDRFAMLGDIVAVTDCIATLPRRMGELLAGRLPLQVLPVPAALPPLVELLQWKPAHDADPGMAWFRNLLHRVANAS